MSRIHLLMPCAVVVVLCLASTSDAAPKKEKKKSKPVRATVTEIKRDQDREEGSLVVKTVLNKKKGEPAEMTFKVTPQTKIQKAVKKKDRNTPATAETVKFSAIEKNALLVIKSKDGSTADEIQVRPAKKKTKKKKDA